MSDIVVINEIRSNHRDPGGEPFDEDEFFELSGTPGASLDGLFLIAVGERSGSVGHIETIIDLSGFSLNEDGLFWVAEGPIDQGSQTGDVPDLQLSDGELDFQNSDNTTYLLVRNFSGAVDDDDLDTDDNGVFDFLPWDVVLDAVSLVGASSASPAYSSVTVGPDTNFSPGHIFRTTDTTGDFAVGNFDFGVDDTPGLLNAPNGPGNADIPETAGSTGGIAGRLDANADGIIDDDTGSVGPVETTISEIQGSDAASPLVGQTVTVTGIVTGDFQSAGLGSNGDLGGFYIQQAEGDGDPTTSDGVFISDLTADLVDVDAGSLVQITGLVREIGGETQIIAESVQILEIAPALTLEDLVVTVDLEEIDVTTNQFGDLIPDLEAFEGMLVTFEDLTVLNIRDFDQFGSVTASAGDLPLQFTQDNAPSVVGYQAYLEDVAARTIVIDDGSTAQNPDPLQFGGQVVTDETALSTGDTISTVTGVLRFGPGAGTSSGGVTFRLNPTEDFTVSDTAPRDTLADFDGSGLVIASFNVRNFFTSLDNAANLGNSNPLGAERGADTVEEYERQLERLVEQIIAMDADVIGLQEIENNGLGEGSAIVALVNALNEALGSEQYAIVDRVVDFEGNLLDRVGGDAIQNVVIYRSDRIQLAEGSSVVALTEDAFASLGIQTDANVFDGPGSGRVPVFVTFTDPETGRDFTIINNHYQSRGFSSSDPEPAAGDGQGNNNLTRTLSSEAVLRFLETNPTGVETDNVILVGDLNAYAQEDPLTTLADSGLNNLLADVDPLENITFVFGNAVGSLDYVLGTSAIEEQVIDTAVFNVNAGESDAFDFNIFTDRDPTLFDTADPIAASDHNPVLVSLALGDNGETLFGTDGGDSLSGLGGDDLIIVRDGADVVDGGMGEDTVSYAQSSGSLVVDLSAEFTIGLIGDDILNNIEGFIGTANADTLIAGDGAPGIFRGGRGADVLTGGAARDRLNGGQGRDTLDGGPQNDLLEGGGGDDLLLGGGRNDSLRGGDGSDTLNGGDGNDLADYILSRGDDIFINLETGDVSGGDAEGDILIDVENARTSSGDDTLIARADGSRLFAGGGDDSLVGGAGDDELVAGGGDDTLVGNAGNDRLFAGKGNDRISDGAGNDDARGGRGADTLIAGAGDDTLTGGVGRFGDVFVFGGGTGSDTITDFNIQRDTLDLSGISSGATDIGSLLASVTQPAGSDNILLDLGGGDSLLLFDVNADQLSQAIILFASG